MSAKLVKRYNAIGWDWYLVSDECESWVSHDVKDHIEAREAENAKLRELVKGLMGHVTHPPCEGCMAEMNCDCSDLTQCDEWSFFEADARRLGIEVD